jgi:hypothetical protein
VSDDAKPPLDQAPHDPPIGDDLEGAAAREKALRLAVSEASPSEADPLKGDFRNFVYLLWKELGLPDPTRVQYEIAHFLQTGPKRRMVLAFRGVAKTWLTGAYVLWRLYRNPLLQVLVVSASAEHAKSVTGFILKCILEVDWLKHLTPDEKKGHRTSTVNFDVNGSKVSVQPSVRARGITGQLPGNRADIIVADDVEIPKNSDTVGKREALVNGSKEFAAILKPGGEILWLGTYQSEESIYKDLPSKGYTLFVVPARYPTPEQRKAYGDTLANFVVEKLDSGKATPGEPVDIERFPEEELISKEMEFGRSYFALQFMLMPTLISELLYPLRLKDLIVLGLTPTHCPRTVLWGGGADLSLTELPNVGFRSDNFKKPAMTSKDQWDEWEGKHMFVDPAGKGQDEIAYAVTGKLGGKIGLLDAGGFMGGYDDANLERLAKIAGEYDVDVINDEDNFGGGMFAKLFKPHVDKHSRARLESVHSVGQKELRIIDTLEPIMNQHRLLVHDALIEKDYESVGDRSQEKQHLYRLFFQMTRITKERKSLKHDDRLEAVAGSVAYWRDKLAEDVDQQRQDKEFEEALEKLESIGLDTPRATNWGDSYNKRS